MRFAPLALAFVLLMPSGALATPPAAGQACNAAGLDVPVCGNGKRTGWYFDRRSTDADDLHMLVRGTEWLELSPAGTTLTMSSDSASTLTFTGLNLVLGGTLSVTGGLTFTGALTANGGIILPDDADITLGTGSDANISFDAVTQAPDTLFIGVGTESRQLVIGETADIATDLTIAQQTNPTLNIHSADATTATDYVTIAHDQTDGVIGTGGGNLNLTPTGGTVAITGDLSVSGNILGAGSVAFKGYSAAPGNASTFYMGGYYQAPATEAVLNQGALTQTYGSANNSYAAHAIAVAKQLGATDGTDLVITVSGVSITDAGVRNGSDSEIIVADATAASTDDYFETAKKWLGQITYTISSTGGATYDFSFDYGFAKYDDFGNRAFTVTDTECVWKAGANETNMGLTVFHHDTTGWTYSAAAFVPGGGTIADLDTDHSTDDEFDTGEYSAYKRAGLTHVVNGANGEGVIIQVSHAVNNSIDGIDCHVGVTFQ